MADMDLDGLDVPKQAPTRPGSRFAPKGSKFLPKAKPKIGALPSKAKDESNSKPPLTDAVAMDTDVKPPPSNDAVAMDSDDKAPPSDAVVMDFDDKTQKEDTNDSMNMEDKEEEKDYVKREIDVYFNPSIGDDTKLYILQYPLRPVYRPYDLDDRCEEIRVKPSTNEVEVDLKIDLASNNYDRDADPTRRITKETLITKWKPTTRSGYAIGLLKGDKLFLNPIEVLVQLRPSLDHNNPKPNVEDIVKKEVMEPKQPIKTLQDQWVPLKYHGSGSVISDLYLKKMMEKGSSQIQFTMSTSNYLDTLCSLPITNYTNSKVPSKRSLLSLPLEERFKCWLVKGAKVHRFDTLKHYLNPGESEEELLEVVEKYGNLVQGLWVAKSEILGYEEEEKTLFEIARDMILRRFNKSIIIKEKELPQSPTQLVTAITIALQGFAVKRSGLKDWRFKELPDHTFIKLHPDIVKKQEEFWEANGKKIKEYFEKKNPKRRALET